MSGATAPTRTCGPCTACCITLKIDDGGDGFTKEPNTPCSHCSVAGRGCTIYETRYAVCREFQCGWLIDGSGTRPPDARLLDDAMRPDHSGVIITSPGLLSPEVMFGYPVLVLHETHPGAVDAYWGERIVRRLSGRAILVTTGGRHRVYAPTLDAAEQMAEYLDRQVSAVVG